MQLGKVIGTVIASQKDEKLVGLKFMLVKSLDTEGKELSSFVVAVDSVGAGVGELVLYATGSSARQTTATNNKPVDATIMAIVDSFEIGGVRKYQK